MQNVEYDYIISDFEFRIYSNPIDCIKRLLNSSAVL